MTMSTSESATPRLYLKTAFASQENQVRTDSAQLFRRVLAGAERAADFLTNSAGMLASYALDCSLHVTSKAVYPSRDAVAASTLIGLCSVLFLQWNGAYRGGGSLLHILETERALRIPALSVLLLLAFRLFLDLRISYIAILIALIVIPVLVILQKLMFFSIVRSLHRMGVGTDRAIIYGAGDAGKRIVSALFQSLRLGILPVGVIDDHPAINGDAILEMGYGRRRSLPVYRGPITAETLKLSRCSLLILALPNLPSDRQAAAVYAAKQAGVGIAFLSGLEVQEQRWTQSIDLDGFSLTPKLEPLLIWHHTMAKRAVDLIVATFLLVFSSPLLLLIAILIKLDSPGPALFIQKRVGRYGELFNIYKFRSMYAHAPRYDFSPASSRDFRITRAGRFIRKTSLDELPQLMNVFLGNMSLVGPRPEMPFIVHEYTNEHRQRLEITPGITGLWQLSADRALPIHENIQYDLYYMRNRGFFLDIAILIHTLFFAIQRDA
jgi:exopolysaccharide biosynthesis polyprenyl glycosylphosphotransferase